MQRSFWLESKALYDARDYIIQEAARLLWLKPSGITIMADGTIVHDPLPEMPPAFKEALAMVDADIARLMAEHQELAERRRYYLRSH